jgi:hypothetical protein
MMQFQSVTQPAFSLPSFPSHWLHVLFSDHLQLAMMPLLHGWVRLVSLEQQLPVKQPQFFCWKYEQLNCNQKNNKKLNMFNKFLYKPSS